MNKKLPTKKPTKKPTIQHHSTSQDNSNCKKQKKTFPNKTQNKSTDPNEYSDNNADNKIITRFKKKAQICGICYQNIEKQGFLEICKHEFCFGCIQKWSKTENTCPICKKRFSKIKNVWRRPYYGENLKKKLCTPITKDIYGNVQSEEIEIPYRDQSSCDGISVFDRLLNLLISNVPILSEELLDTETSTNAASIQRYHNELATEIFFYTGIQNTLNQIINSSGNNSSTNTNNTHFTFTNDNDNDNDNDNISLDTINPMN